MRVIPVTMIRFEFVWCQYRRVAYFENLFDEKPEKFDELKELIKVFHELQIPDTDAARNKEENERLFVKYKFCYYYHGMIPPPSFFLEKTRIIIHLMCYPQ